MTEHSRHFNER